MALPKPALTLAPGENFARLSAGFDAIDANTAAVAQAAQAAAAAQGTANARVTQDALATAQAALQASIDALRAQYVALGMTVGTKANQQDLINVANRADAKANQDDLIHVAQRVETKAAQTYVDAGFTSYSGEINRRALQADFVAATAAASARADGMDARAAGIEARATALTAKVARNAIDVAVRGRPGDDPRPFTWVQTLADLVADRTALPPVPAGLAAFGDDGSVLRLTGPGILATRALLAVEPGRLYAPRVVLRRRAEVADPSDDAVWAYLVLYDQAGNRIVGGTPPTLALLQNLRVADGRRAIATTYAKSGGVGVRMPALPPGAAYARLAVQSYATTGQLDVEVLELADVTDASLLQPFSQDADARLSAIESLHLGPRMASAEAGLGTPALQRFRTVSDAVAGPIAASTTLIETLGQASAGDGGGTSYRRVAQAPGDGTPALTAQDGSVFASLPDRLSAFLPVTRAGLSRFVVPLALTAFCLAGHTQAGDLGAGTPMTRITAQQAATSRNAPVKDALGNWFEINVRDGARPGWFGARYDGTTNDTAAHVAALASDATLIRLHPGIAPVTNLTMRVNQTVEASGVVTQLRAAGPCDHVIRVEAGATLSGAWIEGALLADTGVLVDGTFAKVEKLYVTYCVAGLTSTKHATACRYTYVSTALNTFGLRSTGGFNNSTVLGQFSTNDNYAIFLTYTGDPNIDQPQAVRMSLCTFFGNGIAGLWCEKNVFGLDFHSSVIDGCPGTAVRIAPNSANVHLGPNNFIGSSGIVVDIGRGTNEVNIFSNFGIGNGSIVFLIRASNPAAGDTDHLRCTYVRIRDTFIGPTLGASASSDILWDSPDDTSEISDCQFANYRPVQVDLIAVVASDPAISPPNKPLPVKTNRFPITAGLDYCLAAVSAFLTKPTGNVGWRDRQSGGATMPAGQTSVTVPLSLQVAPTRVIGLVPTGLTDIGLLSVDGLGSKTGLTIHCRTAPSADTGLLWEVAA